MSEHDFYFEWNHAVRQEWRDVIAASPDGTTLAEAREVASERLRDMVDRGELKIPVDSAILAALKDADKTDNRQADKMLGRVLNGEQALDMDGDSGLDVVVALGDGLRKTLRHINYHDLLLMDQLRYRNMRASVDAYDEWRSKYEAVMAPVMKHGSVGAAVASGELGMS